MEYFIARDKNGYLKGYDKMPQKKEEYGFFFMRMWYDLDNRLFPEVTWENSPKKVKIEWEE